MALPPSPSVIASGFCEAIFLFVSALHDIKEDCFASFLATAKTAPRNDSLIIREIRGGNSSQCSFQWTQLDAALGEQLLHTFQGIGVNQCQRALAGIEAGDMLFQLWVGE